MPRRRKVMQREIILALANMQLRRYSAQFESAKRQAVERGLWPTNTAPRGYKVKHRKHSGDGRLKMDKREAAKVVKAFEARAGGDAWSKVAEILGSGYTGARKTIANRAYLGETNLKIDGEPAVNKSAHEPIVSRDLWEASQIAHPRPARGVHGPALLAGLVRCASCQRTMTPNLSHGQRNYRCRGYHAGAKCEAPAVVSQRLIDPYVEEAVLSKLHAYVRVEPRTDELAEAEAALNTAEAELSAFQEATSASQVGAEHFASGLKQRVADVDAAREALGRIRRQSPPRAHADALDVWEELSVEDRRAVLSGVLGVVWVRKGRAPLEDRVRLVALGDEPSDLSRPGSSPGIASPLVWDSLPA